MKKYEKNLEAYLTAMKHCESIETLEYAKWFMNKMANRIKKTIKQMNADKPKVIDFSYIENWFPYNQGNDELSFIENIMPNGVFCHHIDSYTIEREDETIKRFQGCFYFTMELGGETVKRFCPAPLSVLKKAKNYQMTCYGLNDMGDSVNCYTIWFD